MSHNGDVPATPILLYSTVAQLAHAIAEEFYGEFYAVCSPGFDEDSPYLRLQPPSSTPRDIYASLWSDVRRRDRHSAKIASIKAGMLYAADLKHRSGIITDTQKDHILGMIGAAEFMDYKPLLYVIPYNIAAHLLVHTSRAERASEYSEEYTFHTLSRNLFDVLDLTGA